jgi:DNA-binding NarL/FixJ family response regulator
MALSQGIYGVVSARIIIADQNPDAMGALKTLLEYLDYDIVGEISSVDVPPRVYSELHPDLVLMDWQFFKQSRANLINYLARQDGSPRLIIMGHNADDGRRALAAGAHAFVSKSDPADWLLEALRLAVMPDDSGEEGET